MTEIKYIGKCLVVETNGNEKKKILVVGDMHLGYEESLGIGGVKLGKNVFNESVEYIDNVIDKVGKTGEKGKRLDDVRGVMGINSGNGMSDEYADEINNIIEKNNIGVGSCGVDEIVLLGDVKQEFGEITKNERENIVKFLNWADEKMRGKGKIIIVKGNHDAILWPILRGKERVEVVDKYIIGGVLFIHGDKKIKEIEDKKVEVVVMGHWHPIAEISEEKGVKRERYKCFLHGKQKGKEWIIVPSFSEQRYGKDIRDTDFDKVFGLRSEKFNAFVVSDKELDVLDFGELGKIGN